MRTTLTVLASMIALLPMAMPSCLAHDHSVWKIEEDWEMVVQEPDSVSNSPQVTFATCPNHHSQDVYFQLQMNYAADTDYSEGGFRVAAINNDEMVDEARSETRSPLNIDGDLVRWTNVMAVIDNNLLFAIKDGHGSHWGDFGGPEYLVRISNSAVSDLSDYRPQNSLGLVDISFGANRVASITLTKVRVYYVDGQTEVILVNGNP